MGAWETISLIGIIGLVLVGLALVGFCDQFYKEREALKMENAELRQEINSLTFAEPTKDYFREAVQEKLNDKVFETTYKHYEEKMKWFATEDALRKENVELRAEIRRLEKSIPREEG